MRTDGNKRSYHSPDRVEGAQATAKEILRAAKALFESKGYTAVTMKDIARAAAIAPATLYLHFGSKASLVGALARAITDDPELSVERVEGEGSITEQLRLGASILRRLNERSWVVADILRTHGGSDPELTALATEWQQRHLDAVMRGVAAIAKAGHLRAGLDLTRAADILYAIGGTDVYRTLVRERAWPREAYESWLAEFAEEHLISKSRSRPRS